MNIKICLPSIGRLLPPTHAPVACLDSDLMRTIGEKLEEFHLALMLVGAAERTKSTKQNSLSATNDTINSNGNNNNSSSSVNSALSRLIECMIEIERHESKSEVPEAEPQVVQEIINDCRRKTAQIFRAPLAEAVQNVIATSRKRLASKAALSSGDSSYQHSQRHFYVMVELLGSWSNMVTQCCGYGFSRPLMRLILSPLYVRISEAAVECFKTFKRDKELEQWVIRLLDENEECKVSSVDSIVAQVAAVRSMLHQHYTFHYSAFCNPLSAMGATSAPESGGVVDNMLVVTQEELLQWRELDALYLAVEYGFMRRATQQALDEVHLLEIEDNVIIPQSIEDYFFVLVKACERAAGTGSQANLFSVGSRIVDYVRLSEGHQCDDHSALCQLMKNKDYFGKCVARQMVSKEHLQKVPKKEFSSVKQFSTPPHSNNPRTNPLLSSITNSVGTSLSKSSPNSAPTSNSNIPATSAESAVSISGEQGFLNVFDTAVSVTAAVSFSDVHSWFTDQLSPYTVPNSANISAHNSDPQFPSPPSSTFAKKSASVTAVIGTSANGVSSDGDMGDFFSELEVKALPWWSASWAVEGGELASEYYDFCAFLDSEYNRLSLKEADWVVQINSLCTVTDSISALQRIISQNRDIGHIYVSKEKENNRNNNSVDLICQELEMCHNQYKVLLDAEGGQLAAWTFISQIQFSLKQFCKLSFEINGLEMERRLTENHLFLITQRCLGPGSDSYYATGCRSSQQLPVSNKKNGVAETENDQQEKAGTFLFGCGVRLSQGAYVVVLREICRLVASHLLDKLVLSVKFNEWGALLLYQEVMILTRYAESLVDHLDESSISTIKQSFAALNLAMKILTLDAPGDIRKYILNFSLLDEEQVRAVLSRRVEFSVDAIAKVKLRSQNNN